MVVGVSSIVGSVAGILTAASMVPQVAKSIKERKGAQISIFMLLLLFGGNGLWIWYGMLKTDWPIILTNCFSILMNTIMVFLRFKYKK